MEFRGCVRALPPPEKFTSSESRSSPCFTLAINQKGLILSFPVRVCYDLCRLSSLNRWGIRIRWWRRVVLVVLYWTAPPGEFFCLGLSFGKQNRIYSFVPQSSNDILLRRQYVRAKRYEMIVIRRDPRKCHDGNLTIVRVMRSCSQPLQKSRTVPIRHVVVQQD